MWRIGNGCPCSALSCIAALLISLSGLAANAQQIETLAPAAAEPGASNLAQPDNAQILSSAPPSATGADLWTRSQLTGDWHGSRDSLADHGWTFFGDLTQYYQGVAAGGLAQQFNYGGRGDYLIDVDTRKLGLWEGGHLDLRGETRLGQDCNDIDGAVAPSNFAMALPLLNQNVTALTGLQYTQDLSERVSVFAGKLNLLDGTPASYARGMRLNYFWNAAMQSNLSRAYLIPSTLGAGFTVRSDGEPAFNFYILNTDYTPTTSGFPVLFSNGMLVYGEYRLKTNWFDLPGHSIFGFLYSDAARTALDTNPYLLLARILAGLPAPTKNNSWTATYHFDQIVYADSQEPERRWLLSSDFGLTDGDPNPIHWFANVSLVGNSPIRNRAADTIGIGYYHLGISNLPIFTIHNVGAENGVELFYNAAVTPWFHITPDLQILDPAQHSTPTALLVGVRARLSF